MRQSQYARHMSPNVLPSRWTLTRRVIHAIADAVAQFVVSAKTLVAGYLSTRSAA